MMMASSAPFTCAMCLEQPKEPRALPCLHTFCTMCIEKLVKPVQWKDALSHRVSTGRYLECPVCRERHEVPREGVTGFRKNFMVEDQRADFRSTNGKDHRDEMCSEHSLELKLFCEDCCTTLCSECYVERHMGHNTSKFAEKACQGRADAIDIVKTTEARRKNIEHHIAVLKQLQHENLYEHLEEEIDSTLRNVIIALQENARNLKANAKELVAAKKDAVNDKLMSLAQQRMMMGDLKNVCEDFLKSSDAKLVACITSLTKQAHGILDKKIESTFHFTDAKFDGIISAAMITELVLGNITTKPCVMGLDTIEVDPDLLKAEEENFPKENTTNTTYAARQSIQEYPDPGTYENLTDSNTATKTPSPPLSAQPLEMQDIINNLSNFPTLNDPLEHLTSMYTYDSPEPQTTAASTTTITGSSSCENMNEISSTNHNTALGASNAPAPTFTWQQMFNAMQGDQLDDRRGVEAPPIMQSSNDIGLNRPKAWSTLFQRGASPGAESGGMLPVRRSSSSTSVPRSIHYDSASPRRVASPAVSNSSGDTYDAVTPINIFGGTVEPNNNANVDHIRATQGHQWERDGVGSSVITVDVTSSGNVAVLDKESFSVYDANGNSIFNSPRKYVAKCMTFITVDKVEFVVELHRDHILRFQTRDGYKLPTIPPTYDTARATQFQLNSAAQMLFITYTGGFVPNELETDYIQVFDCARIPPSPLSHFSTGVKGMRSMCALDTPRGVMLVLLLSNQCQREPNQSDVVTLAFDIEGKMLWRLKWNAFSDVQVLGGFARYDFKATCTDGYAIYVLEKLTGTVYLLDRDGRRVRPIIRGLGNNITHMTINKRKRELVVVNSEGFFSHYKLTTQ